MFSNDSQPDSQDAGLSHDSGFRPYPPDDDKKAVEGYVEYIYEEFNLGLRHLGDKMFQLMMRDPMGPNLQVALRSRLGECLGGLKELHSTMPRGPGGSRSRRTIVR